ncbi:hypothetical protein ACFFTN_27580 [Aminobacter aganoensis]|uniref:Uncharacterized protein n=1 Tax=Aminobacter aganoensis TaxID=83264 RepID=A0A7X0KNY5_9HYPH|nr:hypothetical protein [Aminobacter aganoensis]MBB6357657.1 hypothetical protein [Aminobacter aganoensis]
MIRLYEFRGHRYLLRELSEISGVEHKVIYARLKEGWSVEQAVCIPSVQQRRAGVVFNFLPVEGTGAGSTAQESPEITFSEKAENA